MRRRFRAGVAFLAIPVLVPAALAAAGAGERVQEVEGFWAYARSAAAWARGDAAGIPGIETLRRGLSANDQLAWLRIAEWIGEQDSRALVAVVGLHVELLAGDLRAAAAGQPRSFATPATAPRASRLEHWLPSTEAPRVVATGPNPQVSLLLVRELLRRYGKGAGSAADPFRSRTRFVLGLQLRSVAAFAEARKELMAAAALPGASPEAALAAAAIDERLGELPRAREALLELAGAHPELTEARLRLSIVEARLGTHPATLDRLLALAGEEAPEWMRIVAREEAVALLERRGERARAIELLHEARRLHPAEPGFALQLLRLLEVGDPAADPFVAEILAATRAGSGPSPRALYNSWPEGAAAVLGAYLDDVANARPHLLRVLEKLDAP